MALLVRSKGVVALVLGGALVLALTNGCGSSSQKKATRPPGDAGAAGEAGSPSADAGASGGNPLPSAGAAGTVDGEGGEGGAPQAGAGGDSSQAGVGGLIPSPECMPSGAVAGVTTLTEPVYQACRGASVHVPVSIEQGSEFICCGTSDAETPWSTTLTATTSDGTGEFVFLLANDVPLGAQSLAVTCASGPTANNIAIEVNEGTPPVVSEVTASITPSGNLTVTGSNLSTVTQAYATSPAGGIYICNVHSDPTDTELVCDFDGTIPPSPADSYYRLYVSSDECGFAAFTPQFQVFQPTF